MTYGNRTLYNDIPIPFTRWAIILDIGRYASIGYRLKNQPTLASTMRTKAWRLR